MERRKYFPSTDSSQRRASVSLDDDGGAEIGAPPAPSNKRSLPPRSILKVRFSDDVDGTLGVERVPNQDPIIEADSQPSSPKAHVQRDGLLLPQPPPPAPPPDPSRPLHLGPPPPRDGPLPPSLFIPEIDLHPWLSGPAYRLYTKFLKGLSQFVDHQTQLSRNRLAVQEGRRELKRLRDEVSQCDVAFMNHVRRSITEDSLPSQEERKQLFEEARTARDRYGPFEAEFELMEVKLGAEEDTLSKKYAELAKCYDHFFRLREGSTTGSDPSEIMYEEMSTASNPGPESQVLYSTTFLHGTVIGQEVLIGQQPMIAHKGRSRSIPLESHVLRKHERVSQKFDLGGSALNTEFEDDRAQEEYPEDLLEISGAGDVGMAHAQSNGITEHTISSQESLQDLVARHLETEDGFGFFAHAEDFLADVAVDPRLEDAGSLLLFDDSIETRSDLHDYLMDFSSTPERVNKWILHQLRLSRRETFTFWRCLEQLGVNKPRWCEELLRNWALIEVDYTLNYTQGSISDENENILAEIMEGGAEIVRYPPQEPQNRETPR